ncbi:hypothetical protein NQ314_002450 [Rhamnusium bicolor]|uniref:CRA domain-containing protein n=1 Tax=Rhamnusium bicolor TaxID=1586634 RepID=A0AAV8ZPM3_9CUCU|nr:hypothetical protein NQ314_002450 [Rhamnusium bicolor]
MEACLAVEKEVDRVFSKFGGINDHAKRVLSDLVTQIQSLKEEYQSAGEDHVLTNIQIDILKQNMAKVKETVSKLATDHRDLHSTVSKVGKAIDRNFVSDFAATSREDVFASPEKINLMNKFIELLRKGATHQTDAICYARTHFRKFVHRHEKDIQTLMGMLLYIPNGINSSPYSCLLDTEMWIEIYELFIRDACQLLGVCVNSPLTTCVNSGCTAIPALLNIKQVMMQRQVTGIWNGKDELPIEKWVNETE